MRIQRCLVPISALTAILAACVNIRVTAAEEWEDENVGDQVGQADVDMDLEEDFVDIKSVKELSNQETARQKRQHEEEAARNADEEALVVGDDEEVEEDGPDYGAVEAMYHEDPDAELALDARDFEFEDEETPPDASDTVEQPAQPPVKPPAQPPAKPLAEPPVKPPVEKQEEPKTAEGPLTFQGQVVQTKDEDGLEYDASSLTPENDFVPNVTEFVDKAPTFKKEEQEKEKKKEEQKSIEGMNNNIDVYEKEYQVFLAAKEKNNQRFNAEVANAEADIEAPKAPSWWQRLKHWFSKKMDRLVERFGSKSS